ncbi:sodium:proton exchanger [Desulfuribacillus stibiiarsenatis]|uniref:Sodium:proton exchanger n=1 Tax=Desulfuribacillus stibiiarsenatis TaxID=1390249 RepID=A0A1E5L8Q0_9FIRM|nr:calcium/sodium antiporter [Desulfuribacillus stibiiarsenatis]OEH86404.1 sodium:proton exchanger [Desulfuribacillus stibiiarsenatis]
MTYVLLLLGFVLLIKGADYFVEGSSNIAGLLKIPPLLIGLTIVAFGTSSPEAIVSILASINGSADLALGNIVGSNIFNITLVVGITAMLNPLKVESNTIKKEIPFTLLGSIALLILISDISLQSYSSNLVTRGDGLILLLIFTIFLYYIFETARNSREQALEDSVNDTYIQTGSKVWTKYILLTLGGLTGIILGGSLVVNSSTKIAYALGMSETLVGLTIVAVGTSLPELVTSVTAALKKQSQIALGNIVGSNIFNIFFILGASSVISPLPVDGKIFTDVLLMILLSVILFFFSRSASRVGKIEGGTLAVAYLGYLIYIIFRG